MIPLQITFVLAVQTAEVAAQYPETAQPFGTIAGTVREAVTGAAPLRTSVCAFLRLRTRLWNRCGRVDALGAYQIDSVPKVALIYVACEHLREYQPGSLASDTLEIPDSRQLRKDWQVVLTKCDQRPLRHVRGVFEGHYYAAFESYSFVSCPRDAWFVPGDSLDVLPATGKFASPDWSAAMAQRVRWPNVQPDSFGMHRYFARWRGTIEGPGRYGHMGLAPFVFHVDSMLEFRAPSSADCR